MMEVWAEGLCSHWEDPGSLNKGHVEPLFPCEVIREFSKDKISSKGNSFPS